jgi:hypothetical protein
MHIASFVLMSTYQSKKLSALFAASLALTCATGCGKTLVGAVSAEIPKQAIPSTVDAGLNKLDDAETQRKIERIVQSPEIRNVERELIAGLLDGTLSTLSDEERSKRIGELTSKAMAGFMSGTAKHIGPMAANMTRGAIRGALDEALSPARREALTGTMGAIISTSIQSTTEGLREAEIGKSVSSAMSEEIGPAMQKTLRDNLAPGLAEVLKNEDLRRELGLTMRVMGKEMVLGATEALAQTQQQPAESGSLLGRITNLASQGARLFGSAAWLLLLVIVALGVWVVKLIAQARRYREEAHRREATALLLEEAAKASEGKPWSEELLCALEERFKDDKEAAAALKRARRAVKRARTEGPPTDIAGRPRPSLA